MRLLICGDRNWTHQDIITRYVEFHEPSTIIEGEALGADRMGRIAAETLGIPVLKFPADWAKFGKGAGPIRNQQMLDEGKPDHVLACHWDILNSKGTKDMIRRALRNNIPVDLTIGVHYYPLTVDVKNFYLPSAFESFLEEARQQSQLPLPSE